MPTLEQLFDSFKTKAFRFEALPAYHITETEELSVFESFTKGEQNSRPADAGWIKCLTQWKSEGKEIQRVRMIPSIPTPYLKFELEWGYPFNIAAGENISVILESEVRKLTPVIPPDFWIFDSQYVAVFEYSARGEWLGATILDAEIDPYLKLATTLKSSAAPLSDFQAHTKSTSKHP